MHQPIFIDETDYLFRRWDVLDVLRDIYDLSGCPVVLIGEEQMARKIQSRGKFARRITRWIEFSGIDIADTQVLVKTVCEVAVADDLLFHLHKSARSNIGRMVVALGSIESFGKSTGISPVTLADWGDRPLFYDEPKFTRKN